MTRTGMFCSRFTYPTFTAINLDLPPYLQDLWTGAATPVVPYGGIIEPMIDGIALPGEWDGAAKYDASVDGAILISRTSMLVMIQATSSCGLIQLLTN